MKTPSAIAYVTLVILMGCVSAVAQPADIKLFIRETYIHGVPYEKASQFDLTAVPLLLEMLASAQEERYWPNIVVTLGMIGDQRAVDPLIAFLSRSVRAELSHSHYVAKTSVLMALGYVINKTRNRTALNYLKESVEEPAVWGRRAIRWTSPYHASEDDRNSALSESAVIGLALSGEASAGTALRSLQKPGKTASAKRFRAQITERGLLSDALRDHGVIAREGLRAYYGKMDQECNQDADSCRRECNQDADSCRSGCDQDRDDCMSKAGQPGEPTKAQCMQRFTRCNANCTTRFNACSARCRTCPD
ncbi:MAG: hypothetical protein AAB403_00695 [Planctomycetota bacterium]